MIKAVFEYHNYLGDGKLVFSILASENTHILKTRDRGWGLTTHRVTLLVKDRYELNHLINLLNHMCRNEVRVVSVKDCNRCENCRFRDHCSSIRRSIFNLLPFEPKCFLKIRR